MAIRPITGRGRDQPTTQYRSARLREVPLAGPDLFRRLGCRRARSGPCRARRRFRLPQPTRVIPSRMIPVRRLAEPLLDERQEGADLGRDDLLGRIHAPDRPLRSRPGSASQSGSSGVSRPAMIASPVSQVGSSAIPSPASTASSNASESLARRRPRTATSSGSAAGASSGRKYQAGFGCSAKCRQSWSCRSFGAATGRRPAR